MKESVPESPQVPPEVARYLKSPAAEGLQFDFLMGEWDVNARGVVRRVAERRDAPRCRWPDPGWQNAEEQNSVLRDQGRQLRVGKQNQLG